MSGMRRLLLLAFLLLMLMAPLTARASAGESPNYRFETRSANGYRVIVIARTSTLQLGIVHNENARRAGTATYYLARAETRGGKIRSRIGSLGTISMNFHPTGPQRMDQHYCGSPMTRSRPGTFVGTLRFRGEGGYVALNFHRLRGVELHRGPECNPAGARPLEEKGRFAHLYAHFRRGLDATYFNAFTLPSGGAFYYAYTEAGGDEYAVEHEAFVALAPESTFATDDSLSFANLTPPYPFSGTGTLQRTADGAPLWTGSLTASFPGAPNFPLTGPPFKVRLTRSW
ncbi:MAG: hypothetical protein ACTHN3_00990 [Solirubrobacterales bacterium]